MNMLNTRAMQIMEQGLGAAALKHRVISHNLANINTPGYKALGVDFADRFREALARSAGRGLQVTSAGHISPNGDPGRIEPRLVRPLSTSMRSDGNNVDIDAEMVNLAENQIYYQALVHQISARLSLMSTIINEGGR